MADESISDRIEALVAEEHQLLARERNDATDEDALAEDRRRLEQVKLELDQCWDFLRQRRAKREFGQDPETAQPRGEGTVEKYLQ
jgi:predicted dithiol-disulfide oxidoreductase (DUF899 family)